ncbi:FMN-binding negative transcriptional regulator [Luteimonas sp. RIT-PG2_3]
MYTPAMFEESRPDALHLFVQQHSLGMLITHTADGLGVDHLPFLLDDTHAGARLLAHVARANPVWQRCSDGDDVLVVFNGAQGYISPGWYPSKMETHRHVPTWNYETVHARGRIHVRDDATFVRGVVARLTRMHEAKEPTPWKMGDAPTDYLAEELAQIVGIDIELTSLEGKRKLSQNRTSRDFSGVVDALEARGCHTLASAMKAGREECPPA